MANSASSLTAGRPAGLDTLDTNRWALFQMMGVVAEFERAELRERVVSSLAGVKDAEHAIETPIKCRGGHKRNDRLCNNVMRDRQFQSRHCVPT
jgi:DNA invertase Pin-like site-specific DNA recombinase